jgi:hypothetical protein
LARSWIPHRQLKPIEIKRKNGRVYLNVDTISSFIKYSGSLLSEPVNILNHLLKKEVPLKAMIRTLYVCLVAILVLGSFFATGCASEPETTTRTVTATSTTTETETLPPETLVSTETVTRTSTLLPEPTIPFQVAEGITVTEAYDMIQANIGNPDFVLLDIRTPGERAISYIGEDSVLLDFFSDDFATEVEKLDRCKTYLLY